MRILTIEVSGATASGKTLIAEKIRVALENDPTLNVKVTTGQQEQYKDVLEVAWEFKSVVESLKG